MSGKNLALRVYSMTLAVVLVTSATFAWAQEQSAAIIGVVTDSSGSFVSGATITITSSALQVGELTTTSDAQGNYKFVQLPAPGFPPLLSDP